jgi:methylenetetrahydrofolate--tRNA-(uracil-5-)-methyltransferase
VECAWQLARRGHAVRLIEMRPVRTTDAHETDRLAEMVCSNSFRSDNPRNAVGLLKREMELIGSVILEEARRASVPAGDALAVDRRLFADGVTARIVGTPEIEVVRAEVLSLDEALGCGEYVVVATGPLTSDTLAASLKDVLGDGYLYFYDAVAPVVEASSLDLSELYRASRWGKGAGEDYLNVPLSKTAYEAFVAELLAGETVPFHDFEKPVYFEGCLPIEEMAERGMETLRHGPMKPFGLPDPRTGKEPYAAVQLRQDDLAREHWNLVGFQTKLKVGEQRRIFRALPGLAEAVFVRYGSLHRNTYLNGPAHLDRFFRWKRDRRVFFAGQLTGVEGYLESAATGLMVGLTLAQILEGREPVSLPYSTALGSLSRHVSERPERDYQPANVTFGLMDDQDLPKIRDREARRRAVAEGALAKVRDWIGEALGVPSPSSR